MPPAVANEAAARAVDTRATRRALSVCRSLLWRLHSVRQRGQRRTRWTHEQHPWHPWQGKSHSRERQHAADAAASQPQVQAADPSQSVAAAAKAEAQQPASSTSALLPAVEGAEVVSTGETSCRARRRRSNGAQIVDAGARRSVGGQRGVGARPDAPRRRFRSSPRPPWALRHLLGHSSSGAAALGAPWLERKPVT